MSVLTIACQSPQLFVASYNELLWTDFVEHYVDCRVSIW
jgi:hypothetical protein